MVRRYINLCRIVKQKLDGIVAAGHAEKANLTTLELESPCISKCLSI